MIKRLALILLYCLTVFPAQMLQAQSKSRTPMVTLHKPLINIGIKAGFNSSLFFTDQLAIGGNEIKDMQNNYKVGYFAAIFCRFNLKKHHFLQTELSYNISKGSVAISNTPENSTFLQDDALIKTSITSFNLPVLYGYKFIDVHPYGMSFFIGPQIGYIWKNKTENDYSGFFQQEIHETFHPWNYSAVAGLAVNVSNIFFDFRYEAALHSMTQSVVYDKESTETPHNTYDFQIKRRRNIMSFSVGVIF